MKVAIFRDVWEPFYGIADSGIIVGRMIDMPEELIKEYKEVVERLDKMQDALEKLYKDKLDDSP